MGAVHAQGAIRKERGLLSSQGTPIKYGPEILKRLQAVLGPKEVATVCCKAHQKRQTEIVKGHRKAGGTAKRVAERASPTGALIPPREVQWEPPEYSEEEDRLSKYLACTKSEEGWGATKDGQVLITTPVVREILRKTHNASHMGADALVASVKRYAVGTKMQKLADIIVRQGQWYCKNNPKIQRKRPFREARQGRTPGEYWQIDFSELPKCNQFKYLLVSADTFSGWPEAFPCHTNKSREVVRILLKEAIPRFSIPQRMSSDSGPHFIAEVVQGVAKFLQIQQDLHTPWRRQSSGKVKRMNRTLKRQISKLCQETQMKWVDVLPTALMRIQITPRVREGASPFEILYGKPYPVNRTTGKGDQMHMKGEETFINYCPCRRLLSSLHGYPNQRAPSPLDSLVHKF